MEEPLISVIVPVYNVAPYLDRCIHSIMEQTFTNLQIILVDDGSTDESADICDTYRQQDYRIEVIHKKNGGLSDARNAGLSIAQGLYVGFVDSDDYIHAQMYEHLYQAMKKQHADIVCCGYQRIDETGRFISNTELPMCRVVKGRHIMEQLWKLDGLTVVAWNKLYKRTLFDNCRYQVGRYHEDTLIIHELLYQCKKVVYIPETSYYYMQRSGSIMNEQSKDRIQDAIDGYKARIEFFQKKHLNRERKKTIYILLEYIKWQYGMSADHPERSTWLNDQYQNILSSMNTKNTITKE